MGVAQLRTHTPLAHPTPPSDQEPSPGDTPPSQQINPFPPGRFNVRPQAVGPVRRLPTPPLRPLVRPMAPRLRLSVEEKKVLSVSSNGPGGSAELAVCPEGPPAAPSAHATHLSWPADGGGGGEHPDLLAASPSAIFPRLRCLLCSCSVVQYLSSDCTRRHSWMPGGDRRLVGGLVSALALARPWPGLALVSRCLVGLSHSRLLGTTSPVLAAHCRGGAIGRAPSRSEQREEVLRSWALRDAFAALPIHYITLHYPREPPDPMRPLIQIVTPDLSLPMMSRVLAGQVARWTASDSTHLSLSEDDRGRSLWTAIVESWPCPFGRQHNHILGVIRLWCLVLRQSERPARSAIILPHPESFSRRYQTSVTQ